MRTRGVVSVGIIWSVLAISAAAAAAPAHGPAHVTLRPTAAAGTGIGGCTIFPEDNWWHADISRLPVHPLSASWLSHMSVDGDLHPDFGPSFGDGANYGIPITVVRRQHHKETVRFAFAAESDGVRYPLGRDTRIEGGRASDGDRHAILVEKGSCKLYELYATRETAAGWRAGSGAVWSLRSNKLRRDGDTSADAAGLPILPGLLRFNEVRDDRIDHAIRFTTDITSSHHLWPARHDAGSEDTLSFPPMGARFRLDPSFSAGGLSMQAQRVVAAMQKYGLVLADNGSPWFFQGEQNGDWPIRLIEDLKKIPASAFVAVDTSSLMVSEDSAQVQ